MLKQRNIPLNKRKAANLRIHLKKNSLFNISHGLLEVFSWLLLDSKERLPKISCEFFHQVSVALYLVSYMNLRNFNPIFPFKTSKRKLKRLDAEKTGKTTKEHESSNRHRRARARERTRKQTSSLNVRDDSISFTYAHRFCNHLTVKICLDCWSDGTNRHTHQKEKRVLKVGTTLFRLHI